MLSLSMGAKLRVAYCQISSALPASDKLHVGAAHVVDKSVAHCDNLISDPQRNRDDDGILLKIHME